jgi:hypothetical protein
MKQPRSGQRSGARLTSLLRTTGQFVFVKVQGERLSALAYEEGKAVHYMYMPGRVSRRQELFKALPGARYELYGETLIANLPQTGRLLLLDCSEEQPVPLCETETARFGGRKAMFRATDRQLLSIVQDALLFSHFEDGELRMRPLRRVMPEQTWFTAAPTGVEGRPTVFGYFQVLRRQLYWLAFGQSSFEVALPELREEEALLDLAVSFADQTILVRRLTSERGCDYLRSEILDRRGRVVFSDGRVRRSEHPCPALHGTVWMEGALLHATDGGIVQEQVAERTFNTLAATVDVVHEGDTLAGYQSGLLVIRDDRIDRLLL